MSYSKYIFLVYIMVFRVGYAAEPSQPFYEILAQKDVEKLKGIQRDAFKREMERQEKKELTAMEEKIRADIEKELGPLELPPRPEFTALNVNGPIAEHKKLVRRLRAQRESAVNAELTKRLEEYKNQRQTVPPLKEKNVMAEEDRNEIYNEAVEKYKKYDNELRNLKINPEQYAQASVLGGINYAMTLDAMKGKMQEVFRAMKQAGRIVSRAEFEKIKDRYYLDKPHVDLTRIWGVEYLKKKFNENQNLNSRYGVPDYVIVADNPNELRINLDFGNEIYPIPRYLENAKIYFEKISGKKVASGCRIALTPVGYDDFSDEGNIIEDSTGKRYVVDTEAKSFAYYPIEGELYQVLKYGSAKFRDLNKDMMKYSNYEFDIDLSK